MYTTTIMPMPLPLSVGLIHVSAAAMVMTKGFGVPQAQEWIEEQYETFGLLDEGLGNPDGTDAQDIESSSVFRRCCSRGKCSIGMRMKLIDL